VLRSLDYNKELRIEQRITTLILAMATVESRNGTRTDGLSGEGGALQWMPNTWKFYCFMFYGKELSFSKENQDEVARKKVRMLIDKGFTNQEIAAFWNCGKPTWEGKVGINYLGVPFDVPAHVTKVMKAITNIKWREEVQSKR